MKHPRMRIENMATLLVSIVCFLVFLALNLKFTAGLYRGATGVGSVKHYVNTKGMFGFRPHFAMPHMQLPQVRRLTPCGSRMCGMAQVVAPNLRPHIYRLKFGTAIFCSVASHGEPSRLGAAPHMVWQASAANQTIVGLR